MLSSRNYAFYGIFIPLHHSFGFPNMILEEGFLDPLESPGSAPGTVHGFDKNIGEVFSSFNALPGYIHADALASKFT